MFILQKKGIFFYLNTPSAPPIFGGEGGTVIWGGRDFPDWGGVGGPAPLFAPHPHGKPCNRC